MSTLSFPLTKADIRNYTIDAHIESIVQEHIEKLSKSILQMVSDKIILDINIKYNTNVSKKPFYVNNHYYGRQDTKESSLVYPIERNLDIRISDKDIYIRKEIVERSAKSILLIRLIEKLKESLPDSTIVTDPLQTYILIDWS